MRPRFLPALRLALALAAPLPGCTHGAVAGEEGPRVELDSREGDRRVDVTVDGRPFTSYLYPATIKKPVLHPLRTATGTAVTRGYPFEPRPGERMDHPHHAGLWFSYGDVNGLDFWNNSGAVEPAAAPRMGTIRHRALRRVEGGRGRGVLEVTNDWVDHAGRILLREDTRFVFRALPGEGRAIDRITTLTTLLQEVRLTDNKEGLLGIRVARELEHPSTTPRTRTADTAVATPDDAPLTGRYRTSGGIEGEAVWGTRARWAMLTGAVAGEPVTLAILDHPDNAGFPTYWHARGYGLFAANPLGQKALSGGKEELNVTLSRGRSMTLRYRVLILTGKAAPEAIEAQYREFTARFGAAGSGAFGSSTISAKLRASAGPPLQASGEEVSSPRSRAGPAYGAPAFARRHAPTIASPIRPIVSCASLSRTHRWSAFSFVSTQATTRAGSQYSEHSVRTWSVAPVLCAARAPAVKRCIRSPSWFSSSIATIVESAMGLTARPCASSSNSRAISLGVVTPRPYFKLLSIATLVKRWKLREWTFVCGSPSASILSHTRRIATRSSSRFVAVLSLMAVMSHAASRTVISTPSCMNCSVPLPGTLSIAFTTMRSSSAIFFCSTRSNSVTSTGTLMRLAVGKVSSPRRSSRSPVSRFRTL